VQPQEYTLIKMKIVFSSPSEKNAKKNEQEKVIQEMNKEGVPVYLVAATLRPETMYFLMLFFPFLHYFIYLFSALLLILLRYGQTNCWVLPKGEYGVYRVKSSDLWICSPHAARSIIFFRFSFSLFIFYFLFFDVLHTWHIKISSRRQKNGAT